MGQDTTHFGRRTSNKKRGKIEFLLGIFLLLPAVFGGFYFFLELFDVDSGFSKMSMLMDTIWTRDSYEGVSASPVYFGLTSIAGAYIIKNSIKYLCRSNHAKK